MIASGDLSNRCVRRARRPRLSRPARGTTLAVPGNHDIPYTLPARDEPVEALRGRLRHHRSGSPHPERGRLRAQLGPPVASSGRQLARAAGVGRAHLADAPTGRSGSSSATTTSRAPLAGLAEVPTQAPRRSAPIARGCRHGARPRGIHQGTAVERHAFQALDDATGAPWSRDRARLRPAAPGGSARQRPPRRALDGRRDRDRDADLAQRPLRARMRETRPRR